MTSNNEEELTWEENSKPIISEQLREYFHTSSSSDEEPDLIDVEYERKFLRIFDKPSDDSSSSDDYSTTSSEDDDNVVKFDKVRTKLTTVNSDIA
jgi:hypothetical protein